MSLLGDALNEKFPKKDKKAEEIAKMEAQLEKLKSEQAKKEIQLIKMPEPPKPQEPIKIEPQQDNEDIKVITTDQLILLKLDLILELLQK